MDRMRPRMWRWVRRKAAAACGECLTYAPYNAVLCARSQGLGIIPGVVGHFRRGMSDEGAASITVPHIGWNGLQYRGSHASCVLEGLSPEDKVYFVHSFRAVPGAVCADWVLTTTSYAGQDFVSAVQKGNVVATQFHPEKSGEVGLGILGRFLKQHTEQVRKPHAPIFVIFLAKGRLHNSASALFALYPGYFPRRVPVPARGSMLQPTARRFLRSVSSPASTCGPTTRATLSSPRETRYTLVEAIENAA